MEAPTQFRQLVAHEGLPEEPRGSTDLMGFYKLTRLYQRISADQPGNFQAQLADTNFASYKWHRTPNGSLASLLNQNSSAGDSFKLEENALQAFSIQPGKFALPEAELGPLIDTSALGDLETAKPEKKKRKRDKEENKAKKEKKGKTLKISFGSKAA